MIPAIYDLMGMLRWAQDHTALLTADEAMALAGALMKGARTDPSGEVTLAINADDPPERHADLWEVVLRIADNHKLIPSDGAL